MGGSANHVLARLSREPLVHFLLGGLLLFFVYTFVGEDRRELPAHCSMGMVAAFWCSQRISAF